jgi:hypothetical protein
VDGHAVELLQIKMEDGRRVYKIGETPLDPARVMQIDRTLRRPSKAPPR